MIAWVQVGDCFSERENEVVECCHLQALQHPLRVVFTRDGNHVWLTGVAMAVLTVVAMKMMGCFCRKNVIVVEHLYGPEKQSNA